MVSATWVGISLDSCKNITFCRSIQNETWIDTWVGITCIIWGVSVNRDSPSTICNGECCRNRSSRFYVLSNVCSTGRTPQVSAGVLWGNRMCFCQHWHSEGGAPCSWEPSGGAPSLSWVSAVLCPPRPPQSTCTTDPSEPDQVCVFQVWWTLQEVLWSEDPRTTGPWSRSQLCGKWTSCIWNKCLRMKQACLMKNCLWQSYNLSKYNQAILKVYLYL